MIRLPLILLFIISWQIAAAQQVDSLKLTESTINNFVATNEGNKLTIGLYGQVDFNKPIVENRRTNGKFDVHRIVMSMAYRFNSKVHFATEIEFEHMDEVYVEQAFLNYKLQEKVHLRAGLLLVPMGIINEYHEPTTFNGVERPNVDKVIVPSTWRQVGAGFTGRLDNASLKYQLYAMSGLKSYDSGALFNAKNGYRSGRQNAGEITVSSINVAARVDYYGIRGLRVGASFYGGDSQSSRYNGIDSDNNYELQSADSSVVSISIGGFDARYQINGLVLRGQFIYAANSNVLQYNTATGSDLATALSGYYVEAGYNVLRHCKTTTNKLVPFVRYEDYDTNLKVINGQSRLRGYHRNEITVGAGFWVDEGAVLKADYQILNDESDAKATGMFNIGIGIAF